MTDLSPKDRWQLLIKFSPNDNDPPSTPSAIQNTQLDPVAEVPRDKGKVKRKSKKKRTISKPSIVKEVAKEMKPTDTKRNFTTLKLLYVPEADHDKISKISTGYPLYLESTTNLPSDPTQVTMIQSFLNESLLDRAVHET